MRAAPDDLFKALADPTRRSIYEHLVSDGEQTVPHVTDDGGVAAGGLEAPGRAEEAKAGWRPAAKDARSLPGRPGRNGRLIDWIAHYRAFWTEHVDRLEQLLEKMDE